jgi:hypothetical protein
LELDIYLPDLKLAFEFNGLYWHSELYKNKEYHLNKTKRCLMKDIHLIHIYEDEWIYKKEIVKSRILNLLSKNKYKIYARKCIIKEVNGRETKEFLNNNHIQGYVPSDINLGLYYSKKLVLLMTFGKGRFKNKEQELLRFCNKLNTSVIGGASKLFKYYCKNYSFNNIVSYADRSWSNGDIYEKLNFIKKSETIPNFYYVIEGLRVNRFKYRKSELIKEGYDRNKTAHKIMNDRNIYRIYNSGNLKFEYRKKV